MGSSIIPYLDWHCALCPSKDGTPSASRVEIFVCHRHPDVICVGVNLICVVSVGLAGHSTHFLVTFPSLRGDDQFSCITVLAAL